MTIGRARLLQGKIIGFSRRHKREIRLIVQLIVSAACFTYLFINVQYIQQYRSAIRFNVRYLLGSWLLTFVAYWLGALGWGLVLRSLHVKFPWIQVAYTHLSSNMAKYIPGFGWQLVGKAYLTHELGLSKKLVSVAMLIELISLYLSGAVIAATTSVFYPVVVGDAFGHFVLLGGILAFFVLAFLPFFLPTVAKSIWKIEVHISVLTYWVAISVIVVGWTSFGVSFWLLGAALFPISTKLMTNFLFTIVGSFLVSLAVIVVPGGIGVRESVMVFLLGPFVGNTPAVLIATVSRLTWLISEIFAYGVARGMMLLMNTKIMKPNNPGNPYQ
jgi:uncharacterized membrane protein YbhN (UPF0104 family)